MNQHAGSPLLPAAVASPHGEHGEPAEHVADVGRLLGLDLARGLAVFGMYAVHVGPDPSEGGVFGQSPPCARTASR